MLSKKKRIQHNKGLFGIKAKVIETKQFLIFRIHWNCKSHVMEDGIVMILWSYTILDIKGEITYWGRKKW